MCDGGRGGGGGGEGGGGERGNHTLHGGVEGGHGGFSLLVWEGPLRQDDGECDPMDVHVQVLEGFGLGQCVVVE